MISDSIHTSRVPRSSGRNDAAQQPALSKDNEPDDRETEITRALCSQLDLVLDELWAFANDPSAIPVGSVALAQLALRLCCLYPRPTPKMNQRIALGEQVLELHGLVHGRHALVGPACVRLTHREATLLYHFVANRDRIVSREELMHEVWGKRLTGPAARTVDIHVHRLRRKLGGEFAERLETVRSVGYKLSTARSESGSSKNPQISPESAAPSARTAHST